MRAAENNENERARQLTFGIQAVCLSGCTSIATAMEMSRWAVPTRLPAYHQGPTKNLVGSVLAKNRRYKG